MKITILGHVPSKKNSKRIVCQGKFPRVLNSKHYEAWHEQAGWQIKSMQPVKDFAQICIKIYAPDKRKADLTNKAESIMDLLVDMGKIEDDNWWVCGDVRLIFGGIDKKNPRAEIEIIVQ
jgi:Holliday junction resolvase RusA-like endonuclease